MEKKRSLVIGTFVLVIASLVIGAAALLTPTSAVAGHGGPPIKIQKPCVICQTCPNCPPFYNPVPWCFCELAGCDNNSCEYGNCVCTTD